MQKGKILIVSRAFLPKEGGIEEYVYNRCLQDPEQVVVLAANCPGADKFDRNQPFPIYRWPNPHIFQYSLFGKIAKQLFSLFWSFIISVWLYQKYRYRSIEWGHGYDFVSLLLLGYLLPVQYFMYLHGNDLLCPLRNLIFKFAFRQTLQKSSGIVCNSSFTKEYLLAHFSVSSPVYVINPTVRAAKFGLAPDDDVNPCAGQAVRQKYGVEDKAILILSVGRLVKRKGFDRVVTELPGLIKKGFDVHYLICGRGAMEGDLRDLARRLDVADRVHFAGYVPDDELASYYMACNIFAMLTFFDQNAASIEGFGIVYLEAGYFGKPVVASRVGGVVDAVHHLENGFLVEPDSRTELLNAFSQLCQDEALRQRLGTTGRKIATSQPSYQVLYGSSLSA